MLRLHLSQWAGYDATIRDRMCLLVVDDGSPEPAEPAVREALSKDPSLSVHLFRITEDIQWNRNGARNLGSHVATTPWLLHTDVDHVLSPADAAALAKQSLDPAKWYRFRRFRVGAADETRLKDSIPQHAEFGEVKPHGDSYLCTRERYWLAGGYDEDYSGHLGGGTPFLEQLVRIGGEPFVLPVALRVHTRHAVPDASVNSLSRDKSHYMRTRARKRASKQTRGTNPLRFTWSRII